RMLVPHADELAEIDIHKRAALDTRGTRLPRHTHTHATGAAKRRRISRFVVDDVHATVAVRVALGSQAQLVRAVAEGVRTTRPREGAGPFIRGPAQDLNRHGIAVRVDDAGDLHGHELAARRRELGDRRVRARAVGWQVAAATARIAEEHGLAFVAVSLRAARV